MNKYIGMVIAIALIGCGPLTPNPCPGQQECSDGTCADIGRVCCDDGESCPANYVCGPNYSCLTNESTTTTVVPPVVSSAEGCLEEGLLPCVGIGGAIQCSPVDRICCVGTGYNCAATQTCGGSCGFECCNL